MEHKSSEVSGEGENFIRPVPSLSGTSAKTVCGTKDHERPRPCSAGRTASSGPMPLSSHPT